MRLVFAFLTLMSFSRFAVAASVADDVERYVRIFDGDKALHSDAADTFSWIGLSDTRLFDIIERRLLADAEAARPDRDEKNRVARYIRSLGFSGQPKYEPTIKRFVGDIVYNRYATAALLNIPQYQKWNPIISDRSSFDPKVSDDVNRVSNMLRSDDLLLKGVGARRVYFGIQEDSVLDLLAQQVKIYYARADLDGSDSSDSVAWMVKALGSSKKEKYKPLIQEVAKNGKTKPVVKHANQALDKYYGIKN